MLLRFPTLHTATPVAESARALPAPLSPDPMNHTAAALTLIAASVPALAVAKEAPTGVGIRGQLETLAQRGGVARPSDTARLQVRFSAPSWQEMEYARSLGKLLEKSRARAERIAYRSQADAAGNVLRGRGVRVNLGAQARAERIRFQSAGDARRFVVLHAPLGEGACFIELRGRQVGVLRGASVTSPRDLQAARRALWSVLPAPDVERPTLLLARPSRETLIVHGALDRRTRGLLRRVVDQSESAVLTAGAEEARAPAGEMRQGGSGRVSAWLDTRADRREATAALSQTLSRIPRGIAPTPRSQGAVGSLARSAAPTFFGSRKPTSRVFRAPRPQPQPQTRAHEVVTLRARVELSLRSQPGGAWNSDLRAGERCLVVGRAGAWLEVTDQSGRGLGWVLFDKDTVELKTVSAR